MVGSMVVLMEPGTVLMILMEMRKVNSVLHSAANSDSTSHLAVAKERPRNSQQETEMVLLIVMVTC
jgi:hypothetical protein